MIVLKFGGTSIGSARQMNQVLKIVNDGIPKIVVLSAMAGTTDKLVAISEHLKKNEKEKARLIIDKVKLKYGGVIRDLYKNKRYHQIAKELINKQFLFLESFLVNEYADHYEKRILATGEILSTGLFFLLLQENEIESDLLPALSFMRTDRTGEPDEFYIKENLIRKLSLKGDRKLFITQGFICRNAFGEIDNLNRGGSDYTASLIGAALEAKEVQIWTDINGFHNNDPGVVKNTKAIRKLSFEEAAELAYFGAKILHPSSVRPCKEPGIPVRLKNTMNIDDEGTLISKDKTNGKDILAVAAKDGITALKIKSDRMLLAYGFLRKVFEIFEIYRTPVDVITTSEVAVSVTIDNLSHLNSIVKELSRYGTVEIEKKQSIICIVGDLIAEKKGLAKKIFNALDDVPIRMISYGGSRYNVSLLVNTEDKEKTLTLLNRNLLYNE